MIKTEKRNKIKTLLLIVAVLLASFASEARAASYSFEIGVRKNSIKSIYAGSLPKLGSRKSQAQIDKEKEKQKLAEFKVTYQSQDSRTEFTDVYLNAGKRFGIDWQILAAVHSVETGQRGDTAVTSSAGAQGPMQFIPSTFRAYAIDGDGDGRARINDVDDAIFTAAHYLSRNLAIKGNIDQALYQYNHSLSYVAKVKNIAAALY